MRKDIKQLEKYCAYCGKKLERKRFENGRLEDFAVFKKRKYCNIECMGKAKLNIGYHPEQSNRSARTSARKIMETIIKPEYKCAICGRTDKKLDVHHKDGNCKNNNPDNLILLCRSCHNKHHHPKPVCKICGKEAKGHGYCNKHLIRFRKYGDPLAHKVKVKEL